MDEIDRILSSDKSPEPSPAFVASVMAAVEREASLPPPLPFPIGRLVAGAIAAAAAIIVPVAAGPHVAIPAAARPVVAAFTSPASLSALAWCAGALLVSWLAIRTAARWTPAGS